MARIVREELNGYRMDLMQGERQMHDNGMPLFTGSGEPRMERTWVFVYTNQSEDGSIHAVMSPPMTDDAREKLIQALTGGVVVPTIHMPNGVQI